MKTLFLALVFTLVSTFGFTQGITHDSQAQPPAGGLEDVKVVGDTITVIMDYAPRPDNVDITVAVTALDGVPPEWADKTVYHVYQLETEGKELVTINDVWPNMRKGHYQFAIALHIGDSESAIDPFIIEIK